MLGEQDGQNVHFQTPQRRIVPTSLIISANGAPLGDKPFTNPTAWNRVSMPIESNTGNRSTLPSELALDDTRQVSLCEVLDRVLNKGVVRKGGTK